MLTATYSIIAIMLGRLGMSVDECIVKYEEIMGVVFKKKVFPGHQGVTHKLKIGPRYDASKVQTEIEKVLEQRNVPQDENFVEDHKIPQNNVDKERRCRVSVLSLLFSSLNDNGLGLCVL